MTAVVGSASQYSSRSLPDTSALLPTLTNVDRPTLPLGWRARESPCPSAPLCDENATRPAGGTIGENDAFSRTRRRGVEQAHAVGPDHPHAVAADRVDELLLQRAAVVADFGESGGDDDQRLDAGGGAVVHDVEHAPARHRDRPRDRRRRRVADRGDSTRRPSTRRRSD